MNALTISPIKNKIRYLRTVVFFPNYHPNKNVLISRFSRAYFGPFVTRFLNREELPPAEFYAGWNIVIVGKILNTENQGKLIDLTVAPPMYVYFKDWENPSFSKIVDPWAKLLEPIPEPAKKKVNVIPAEPDVIVLNTNVKEVEPPPVKPPVKQKERRAISANPKKEVVSVALRNSKGLTSIDDDQFMRVFARCSKLYNYPRIRQRNVVRHILIDIFKQVSLRDPDIEFVNKHVVERVTAIKGVTFDKALGGFDVNATLLAAAIERLEKE